MGHRLERLPNARPRRPGRARHRREQRHRPRGGAKSWRRTEHPCCSPAATSARGRRRWRRSGRGARATRAVELVALDLADLASVRAAAAEVAATAGAARPAGQQRRGDGAAAPRDRRRVRAPARHQPPRPLRPHRPAGGEAEGGAGGPRRHRHQRRPPDRQHRLRRPAAHAAATCAGPPTASRSSPTCSSPWSCSGARSPRTCELRSMAAHPGYAATNLQHAGPQLDAGLLSKLTAPAWSIANHLIGQSAEDGALPTLYAATEPQLPGGSLVGPGGLAGHARRAEPGDPERRRPRRGHRPPPLVDLRRADRRRVRPLSG